jgi:ABC-type uncharacterized transport system substrate-binding protein
MTVTIGRRELLAALGGVAAAWPLSAHAQQSAIPVIGFLDATTAVETVYRVSAFRDGLKEAGFIDGYNVAIEFRWAENKLDRLPALAADLAHRQVAVIVGPITALRMARAATSTIPIVFVSGGDPIAIGLVTNLSRPGGNITGVSFASAPLQPKRLGLLHELVPPPATIAWLRDPRGPGFEEEEKEVPPAARELGRELLALATSGWLAPSACSRMTSARLYSPSASPYLPWFRYRLARLVMSLWRGSRLATSRPWSRPARSSSASIRRPSAAILSARASSPQRSSAGRT